ncbi:hypothetical protein Ga0074812_10933 [Parafrankia irregularis]|uniref:EthD domain-containing protein n=1 Tax=Parafrankia irregularis TaxID=795642 RepID=A0A0S4QP42_9ACTN|nr:MULTISPECIES: EthD domain-containing protein [Parafrankia]MBE3200487.1 EthD domain-containing protein [Parafrankia sp. CH37]CUU56814.1 hypothetical protein Ga0074812_10933 [Parafrankia irregularis]
MIKRILLVTRACAPERFAAAWRAAVGAAATAPPPARPLRLAAGTVLAEVSPEAPHDGIGLQWFTDEEHLRRFEAWSSSPEGTAAHDLLGEAVELESAGVVVAHEHVMRGDEWLRHQLRDGATGLKQMALARRAADLTLAQFFDRWRSRAGSVGTVPIPAEVRGLAYIQNHPLLPAAAGTGAGAEAEADWAYDAVNEVYFDDLDGIRRRMAWFAENLDRNEDDLVRESCFVAVREEIL